MHEVDAVAGRMAQRQHGLVTRRAAPVVQALLGASLGPDAIRRRGHAVAAEIRAVRRASGATAVAVLR